MKVWVEALTPKQILFFSYLQSELGPDNVFLTTRDYDLNSGLATQLWRKQYVVGRYGGATLVSKFRESLRRQRALLSIVEREKPDVHVTFVSPDSARVAFAAGIPIISASDSPHSDAVSRLVIPLSRAFVTPSFLEVFFDKYRGLTQIITFNGVFELAWVLREKPDERVPRELGLEPFNYVLIRPGEHKSYYYPDAERALTTPLWIAKLALRKTSLTVLVYPRYPDQARFFTRTLSTWRDRVKVLDRPAHFVSLEFYARAVVTGGGTIATEASLLGTPAVSTYPGRLEVHEYLRGLGFPIFTVSEAVKRIDSILSARPSEASRLRFLEKAKELMGDPILVLAETVRAIVA